MTEQTMISFELPDPDDDDRTVTCWARSMSTAQILEQALTLLEPVPMAGDEIKLRQWATSTWEDVNDTGIVACSVGAMLLATDAIAGLRGADYDCVPYLEADPKFRRAIELLVRRIFAADPSSLLVRMYSSSNTAVGDALDALERWHRTGQYPLDEANCRYLQSALVDIVVSWNDAKERTSSEVYDLFTDAIKDALAEEEQA